MASDQIFVTIMRRASTLTQELVRHAHVWDQISRRASLQWEHHSRNRDLLSKCNHHRDQAATPTPYQTTPYQSVQV